MGRARLARSAPPCASSLAKGDLRHPLQWDATDDEERLRRLEGVAVGSTCVAVLNGEQSQERRVNAHFNETTAGWACGGSPDRASAAWRSDEEHDRHSRAAH
jgi:hypothetical protein